MASTGASAMPDVLGAGTPNPNECIEDLRRRVDFLGEGASGCPEDSAQLVISKEYVKRVRECVHVSWGDADPTEHGFAFDNLRHGADTGGHHRHRASHRFENYVWEPFGVRRQSEHVGLGHQPHGCLMTEFPMQH